MATVAAQLKQAGTTAPKVQVRQWTLQDAAILAASGVSGASFAWVLFRVTPFDGPFGFVVCSFISAALIYWLVVRDLEGPLEAADKFVTVLIGACAVAVLIPLVIIVVFVAVKGAKALRPGFFIETLEGVGPASPASVGGAFHAIVGTLEQVGIAFLISVPLALLVAIFLNEVGGPLVRPIRFVVDAMSGVPSIVAGLFVYAVIIGQFGSSFSGFAAAVALSILMLPTVIRTSEEMLRIVPGGLREASLALGAPEWRTVFNVVLPTARAGLITAAILGVARAVGETAPLIMTAFGSFSTNWNPFAGPQASLPLFVYGLYKQPYDTQVDRAWTGALVLIVMVLGLFTLARVLGNRAGKDRKKPTLRRKGAAA